MFVPERCWSDGRALTNYGGFVATRPALLAGRFMAVELGIDTCNPAGMLDSLEVLGTKPERPQGYEGLEHLPQVFKLMDADMEEAKECIRQRADSQVSRAGDLRVCLVNVPIKIQKWPEKPLPA
jgi:hypothetical protein